MSAEDPIPPVYGVDPPIPPSPGAPSQRAEAAAALAAAVDELDQLSGEPVHTHAARYHDVHTLLQDALSDTDR